MINAVHASATTYDQTDWFQILALHDQLRLVEPTPMVELNRAVALAEVDGPDAALAVVERLPLDDYYLWHATRADLLRRTGRTAEALLFRRAGPGTLRYSRRATPAAPPHRGVPTGGARRRRRRGAPCVTLDTLGSEERTMTRRLIVQQLVSIDGFVADVERGTGFFDAVDDYSEVDADNLDVLGDVDTILLGRTTYELFVSYWPTAADEPAARLVNDAEKFVYSTTLTSAPWGDGTLPVITSDPVHHVRDLLRGPGGDIVVWGSLSIMQALLDADISHELQLRVVPVTLGDGVRLPASAGAPSVLPRRHPVVHLRDRRTDVHHADAEPAPSGAAVTPGRGAPRGRWRGGAWRSSSRRTARRRGREPPIDDMTVMMTPHRLPWR